ncbi:fibroblast growth factor 18-like X4, partial [Biomphalaria glabrata]
LVTSDLNNGSASPAKHRLRTFQYLYSDQPRGTGLCPIEEIPLILHTRQHCNRL